MENSTWRIWAKTVAIVDTVFQWINIIFAIVVVFVMIGGNAVTINWNDGRGPLENFNFEGIFDNKESSILLRSLLGLVVALISTIIIGIQLWAATKLLDAAEIGTVPTEALGKSRIWRNVTIAIFFIGFVGLLIEMKITGFIVFCLWRMSSFYVVYKFMEELDNATSYANLGYLR